MGKAHQKDEKGLACLRVEIPSHPFLAWCLLFCFFLPLLFDQGLLDEPPSPLNIFCEPLLDKSLTLLYNTRVRSHTSIAVIPTSTIQYPRLIRYSPPHHSIHVGWMYPTPCRLYTYTPTIPVIALLVPARKIIIGFQFHHWQSCCKAGERGRPGIFDHEFLCHHASYESDRNLTGTSSPTKRDWSARTYPLVLIAVDTELAAGIHVRSHQRVTARSGVLGVCMYVS